MEAFINSINDRKEEYDRRVKRGAEKVRTPTRQAPDPPAIPHDDVLVVPGTEGNGGLRDSVTNGLEEVRKSTPPRRLRPGLAHIQEPPSTTGKTPAEEAYERYEPIIATHALSPATPMLPSSLGRPGEGPGGSGGSPNGPGSGNINRHTPVNGRLGSNSEADSGDQLTEVNHEDPAREIRWQNEESVTVSDVINELVLQKREIQAQQEELQRKIDLALEQQRVLSASHLLGFSPARFSRSTDTTRGRSTASPRTASPTTPLQNNSEEEERENSGSRDNNDEPQTPPGLHNLHHDNNPRSRVPMVSDEHSDEGLHDGNNNPRQSKASTASPRTPRSSRIRDDIHAAAGHDASPGVSIVPDEHSDEGLHDGLRWPEREQAVDRERQRVGGYIQSYRKAYWAKVKGGVRERTASSGSGRRQHHHHRHHEVVVRNTRPMPIDNRASIRELTEELARDRRLLRATVRELGAIVEAHKITLAADEHQAWAETNERRRISESASRNASPQHANKGAFVSELSRRLQKIHSESVSPSKHRRRTPPATPSKH
eukprot:TRINITY_DN2711_c0_g1_i1.p1 TRINITY_DN2711_c0_g1~~TRINITY_DN2711_c0_g1_i1.p1  ORF type:complete len:543 (+),score=90.41 TRINITY_DN2711_c0_g1_i1:109-1737(+)